jgi:hypothetical protein
MSTKLKALGLGLFAAMAMSTVAVMTAGAQTGGHFMSTSSFTTILGFDEGNHLLHFNKEGGSAGERIGCEINNYIGAMTNATTTEIPIEPTWATCRTTVEGAQHFGITGSGCIFLFTVKAANAHNTLHLNCPSGKVIEIHHPNCTITVPPQTVNGVSYPSDGDGITLTSTVKGIESTYHGGICIFLGTSNHKMEMVGSITLIGLDGDGNRASISATP